jgi:hypothetical protein
MLSQQKHVVLQSTVPLQLKCFKVGSKMAIAVSTPVLLNQKKQCCKITWFTDAPCITSYSVCGAPCSKKEAWHFDSCPH